MRKVTTKLNNPQTAQILAKIFLMKFKALYLIMGKDKTRERKAKKKFTH